MSFEVYQDIGLKPDQLADHEAGAVERQNIIEQTIADWQSGQGKERDKLFSLIKQQLDQARLQKNELYVLNLAKEFLGRINTVELSAYERERVTAHLNERIEEHRDILEMAA
jgi:hypothetical protein